MEKKLLKVENVDPQIKATLHVASGKGFLLFSYFFLVPFPRFPVLFPTFPNLKFKAPAKESTISV